ncbi:methyl-accepting chemotaxis protein [Acanthopleuribacter pedis]|uniref:HAMP domain-containing protein n=1 Tax=Acanthopleuribacter pedis TaxID=442870 RepID=A0A8J7Q0K6_9BACT|nr:methyl-accepting chemotaxis protein [Acanthopleuribacter pedis]MBO1317025.1 HAMP domain-containing protein [Acanthopleuribacter pedis]
MIPSTIKAQIASLILLLGAILVFMVFYFPSKAKELGENISTKNTEYISSLLTDNLATAMATYSLLQDASGVEAVLTGINDLQKKQGERTLTLLNVYDTDGFLIVGIKDGKITSPDQATELRTKFDEMAPGQSKDQLKAQIFNEAVTKAKDIERLPSEEFTEIMAPLSDAGFVKMQFSRKFLNESVASNRQTSQIIGFGGLILGLIVGFIISRGIINNIAKMNAIMRDIAEGEGDLTKRIEITSKNELSEMASWFNLFLDKLQETIRQISDNASTLNEASGRLDKLAGGMTTNSQLMNKRTISVSSETGDMTQNINTVATAAEDATLNVNSVSSAVEEMSSTLDQVSDTATMVSENTNTIAVALEEMSATINEVTKNTEHAANVSKTAAEKAGVTQGLMNQLGESAESVGRVVQVIDEIAEKTNLLALNASIEAARAGDAGKGFNVVANEVKDLSKQTAEAIQNIVEQINKMQENTQASIAAIREITEIINELNSVNLTIAGAVEEQSVTTNEVSQTTAEAAASLEEVSRNVLDVSRAARDISANSSSLANLIHDISDKAKDTAQGAQVVTKNTQDLSSSVTEVYHGSSSVNDQSKELSGLAGKLQDLVMQFRI